MPESHEIVESTKSVPDQVTITFTENPEPRARNIKIMNSKNERIDNNNLRTSDSDRSLSVTLTASNVITGFYTVNWIVLFKDGGYITKGPYVFGLKTK